MQAVASAGELREDMTRFECRKFLLLAAGAACLPTLPRMAGAQAYPARPIKLIVAFPAGGPANTMGRMVAQAMSSKIGQSSPDLRTTVEKLGIDLKLGSAADAAAAVATDCPRWIESAKLVKIE